MNIIDAFQSKYPLKILSCQRLNSNQNTVYLIETEKDKYILKQYSHDAIQNEEDLKIRREQLRISSLWNDAGISCILPLTDIFLFRNDYYIIYPYMEGTVYSNEELSISQIQELARNQARIHQLEISTFLGNHIKKIQITSPEISFFQDTMDWVVEISNQESCVCHNDYKPLNIMWIQERPYLMDFDAVSKNHPTYSLWEALFTYSYRNHQLDFSIFEEYLKAYLDEYHHLSNLDIAYYGAWNGKIQWIEYLIHNKPHDSDISELLFQITDSYQYLERIYEIFHQYQ